MIGTEIAFRLGPDTIDDARAIARRLAELAPAAVEHVLFCDADVGEYGCLAVWPTTSAVDAYLASAGVAAELAALTDRTGKPVRVRRYAMEYQRQRIPAGDP